LGHHFVTLSPYKEEKKQLGKKEKKSRDAQCEVTCIGIDNVHGNENFNL
jgi:hypothetical protein